jgi:hypothetical protein
MSKRGYFGLVVLVLAGTLGAQLIGEWVRTTLLVALGVAGLTLTAYTEWRKHRITRFLAALPPEDQDALLVYDEGWRDRPEVLAALGRRGPRVPLRAERERFRYAPHHARYVRWTWWGTIALEGVLVCTALFARPQDAAERLSLGALLVGFGGSLAYLPFEIRRFRSEVVVTDAGLSVVHPDGSSQRLSWAAVRDARDSRLSSSLVLRGPGVRIRIGYEISGYGRLANLIATRLPEGITLRAV